MRSPGAVALQGVGKAYGKISAVQDITLSVEAGEFITLLGPSGSGKSTTLMMIAGFELPDSGTISLDGEDVTFVPPHRRNLGIAFQNYALFPHMTVFDNIAFSLKMRDATRPDIRKKVTAMLELVQLAELGSRFPWQLSGGQQQRVALARALVFEPSVLLLDEPLGALDRLLRERMQLELRRVHRQLGGTMIYVTHDQDEALLLSDRIVVMNRGRIEQIGPPSEIYDKPVSRFVAEFVGESNFLCGELVAGDEGGAVVRVGALSFHAPGTPDLSPGQPVEVALRPEKITIAAGESPGDQHVAEIEDVLYVGQTVKYIVRVAGGTRLIVKQQRGSGAASFGARDQVRIAWQSSDVRLFRV